MSPKVEKKLIEMLNSAFANKTNVMIEWATDYNAPKSSPSRVLMIRPLVETFVTDPNPFLSVSEIVALDATDAINA